MTVIEFAHLGEFAPTNSRSVLAYLHELVGFVKAYPPEHRVSGQDDGIATSFQVAVKSVIGASRPVLAVPIDDNCLIVTQYLRMSVQVAVGDHVVIVPVLVKP